MIDARLTPTQQRLLAALSDGLAHPPAELRACLPDDMAGASTLRFHLSVLRRVLQDSGQTVLHDRAAGGYRLLPLAANQVRNVS